MVRTRYSVRSGTYQWAMSRRERGAVGNRRHRHAARGVADDVGRVERLPSADFSTVVARPHRLSPPLWASGQRTPRPAALRTPRGGPDRARPVALRRRGTAKRRTAATRCPRTSTSPTSSGPTVFPDNGKRRITGTIHLVIAAGCLAQYAQSGNDGSARGRDPPGADRRVPLPRRVEDRASTRPRRSRSRAARSGSRWATRRRSSPGTGSAAARRGGSSSTAPTSHRACAASSSATRSTGA